MLYSAIVLHSLVPFLSCSKKERNILRKKARKTGVCLKGFQTAVDKPQDSFEFQTHVFTNQLILDKSDSQLSEPWSLQL